MHFSRGDKMRKKRQDQLNLFHALGSNDIAKELGAISLIIDANPRLLEYKKLIFANS